ncbi:MAG: type I-U CRISPR-associated protein Cas5/Cas6 [Bryobacterales bacterium]|nr:type I-U CRISPR-associated protein Cas5/Cas6 [Bryobacterales bacterium]
MLVLEIELLTGRYVAKQYDDHASAEWPPHPARVFSALTAAHFEDPVDGIHAEREALDWLASQPAPSIYASEASCRSVLDAFVPANDKSVDPSVSEAVNETILAVDEGARATAQRKVEKIGQVAAEPVALTESQRGQLAAAIESVKRLIDTPDVSLLSSALKELRETAQGMLEHRSSRLLMSAVKATARLNSGDRERLRKNLERLGKSLRPPKELLKRALSVLPSAAERKQARTFPSVYAYDPIVQFAWANVPNLRVHEALDGLAGRVTRLGHSSSLVRLTWVSTARDATWIPDARGQHTLRWVSARQLADLATAYDVHRGTANRILPFAPENYRHISDAGRPTLPPRSSVFGQDWVIFEFQGRRRVPIVRAVDVAVALRGAALVHAGANPPEVLSGHGPANAPSERPHVGYVALPFVGFPHADGSILGAAAVLPSGLTVADRTAVLRALGKVQQLTLTPGLAFDVRRVSEPSPHLRTLDHLLWCDEGVVWGTVTPILLDSFPGDLQSRSAAAALKAEQEARDAITRACERIGLPRPRLVSLTAPCFAGSVAADQFRRRRDRQGLPPRVRVHALIDFGQVIQGPVLLGAGRYVGLGLCRPLPRTGRS